MASVFRIEKTSNYVVMANYHLRDRSLSYKAKGLLSYMLSLPDDWDYSYAGLISSSKDEEFSVKSGIKELKIAGYLSINKITPDKTDSGRFEYEYVYNRLPASESWATWRRGYCHGKGWMVVITLASFWLTVQKA